MNRREGARFETFRVPSSWTSASVRLAVLALLLVVLLQSVF
ncbi:hypothetical protein [Natronococcus sp.]